MTKRRGWVLGDRAYRVGVASLALGALLHCSADKVIGGAEPLGTGGAVGSAPGAGVPAMGGASVDTSRCPAPIASSCPDAAALPTSVPTREPPPIGGGPATTAPNGEPALRRDFDLPVILRAADVGEHVSFRALGYRALLAVKETEKTQTVMLLTHPDQTWDPAQTAIDSRAELSVHAASEVVAVGAFADLDDGLGEGPLALLCIDGACALYSAEIAPGGVTPLQPFPNGAVPCDGEVRGLYRVAGYRACVYGSQVCCFDGDSWSMEVQYEELVAPLNDMASLPYPARDKDVIAAGDSGQVVHSTHQEWLLRGYAGPDFFAVAVDPSGHLAAGTDGSLAMGFPLLYQVTDEDIVFLDANRTHALPGHMTQMAEQIKATGDINLAELDFVSQVAGITASGKVFVGRGPLDQVSGLCFTGQVLGRPLGATFSHCGLAGNYEVLTEDTLYGTSDCAPM